MSLREAEAESGLQTAKVTRPGASLPIVFTESLGALLPTPRGSLDIVLSANASLREVRSHLLRSLGGPGAGHPPRV